MTVTPLTKEEIRHLAIQKGAIVVKFVNVAGDYRFHLPQCEGVHHEHLLNDDEKPSSAGFFMLYTVKDAVHVRLMNQQSISLMLEPVPEDQENLQRLFT